MENLQVVDLCDEGILPDTEADCSRKLSELFSLSRENTVFRFKRGTYRLHSLSARPYTYVMSGSLPFRSCGVSFRLKDKRALTIDGSDSRLICSGQLTPFLLDGCEDITLKNFSIDWEKPFAAEGVVVNKSTDYLDLRIDCHLFPCHVRNFSLYFDIGDGQESELTYGMHVSYDPDTFTVTQNCADRIRFRGAEQLSAGLFRLYVSEVMREEIPPYPGSIIVLNHNKCGQPAIFAEECNRITLENISIHSAGGIGALFQFSENLTMKKVRFLPNRSVGRQIACGCHGGFHFSCCRGALLIEDCSFHGLQNDPIEIHGIYAAVRRVTGGNVLQCAYLSQNSKGFPRWAAPGQTVCLMSGKTMKTTATAVVDSYRLLSETEFEIVLKGELPPLNPRTDTLLIDNLSNSPEVVIRNNHFGSGRARGILLVTPRPVLIENNIFESGGAAIMLSNDTSFWYNSGRCLEVIIRNNLFTDACYLSTFQFSYAMITIHPDIRKPGLDTPFHRNIVIENNTFLSPDTPILHAFSVEGLVFRGNRIFASGRVKSRYFDKHLLSLLCCKNACLSENRLIGQFSLETLKADNTTFSEKDL